MHSILYPPTVNYDWMFQRPQQLMRQFARLGWKSYYMNPPAPGHASRTNETEMREENLFLISGGNIPEDIMNKKIFFFSCPKHVEECGRFKEDIVIFDNLDEPVEQFSVWAPWYEKALRRADLVTCSSQKLYDQAQKIASKVILIPNGTDYDHFSRAQDRVLPVPNDMANRGRPIIGYYGALASWVDWELISKLAIDIPQATIILIGPKFGVGELPKHPNIVELGLKNYSELPAYLQMFDVAIIPFKVTEMIESCNPIKMWEYLSAGIPVVTTEMPEAMKHDEIYIGRGHSHFIKLVNSALYNNGTDEKEKRIKLARCNSWESRAKCIMRAVEDIL